MKKRDFIKRIGQAALASPFIPFDLSAQHTQREVGYQFDNDDEFWARIRSDYTLKPEYINLENGYYNFIPNPTLEKYVEHLKYVNIEASHYMRTVQWDNKKRVAARLAKLVGCSADELILTRNATESLDMVIGGFPWKEGDEAIMALQDYGSMLDHFNQIAKRYGVVNKVVSVPNFPESDEEIVSLYEQQITARTKLLMVCHMVNITGQILPVRKICDMAHRHGVEVLVDGAHCIGHFEVNISELHCDYYGSSLHKWLSAPLGVGMLYVAQDKIAKLWPLLADYSKEPDKIQRLNHTGTHPVHSDLAVDNAIDYLELIGIKRKENRLRYLQRYWSDELRSVDHIVVNTPLQEHRSCGIANVGINHITPAALAKILMDEFKIFTVAIDYANVKGCRITPNVYTATEELDHFIGAMKKLANRT